MIRLLVFCSGAILMSLEILGSRVLAPRYGNSVIVWASLISVFLGGLAMGYWLGGALADAYPKLAGLTRSVAAAGLFTLAVPTAAPMVFLLAGSEVRSGSLAAAVLLFAIPTMLLGAVSPYAIRLHLVVDGELGRTAGRLYAISTVGSIAGTIVTAFWLIPIAGVANLIHGLGVALVLLGVGIELASGEEARGRLFAVSALAVCAVIAAGVMLMPGRRPGPAGPGPHVVYEHDSFYHHIVVTDGGGTRILRCDALIQSAMSIRDPLESRVGYTDYLHLAIALNPNAVDILYIGLGGGTSPKQFLHDYPIVRVDVAEIDPEVVAVARRLFYVPGDSERFHVYAEDGRRFMERTERRYDLIVVDAYTRDFIPFHLVTREFFTLCRQRLAPGGLIAMNIIGSHRTNVLRPNRGMSSAALASIYRTAGEVFGARYLFGENVREAPESFQPRNYILIAGSGPKVSDAVLFATIADAHRYVREDYLRKAEDYLPDGPEPRFAKLLTDQYAPVETMLR